MKPFLLSMVCILSLCQTKAQKFEVSFPSELMKTSFTGNVLLYLSKAKKNPKDVFVGVEITPIYRVVVKNIKPNDKVLFNDNAISFPVELTNIERGEYYVQAVFDRNLGGQHINNSTGNFYSKPIRINFTKDFDALHQIVCNEIIKEIEFEETEYLKELKVKSKLLSDFHHKDVYVGAAISLPKEYLQNSKAQYPVIFNIYGFGASYKTKGGFLKDILQPLGEHPAILVDLDGNCPEGHSVYANSDINGPWGDALVKEFIPELNKKFRTNGANLLHGHSSGGWSSLWLQINYPTTFIGTWSSSPDQVDFRNYQNKNIYKVDNFFYNKDGEPYYDVTLAGRFPLISTKDFYQSEHVVYRGEQMHSFDAVFGGKDKDGNKIRLVNPVTGEINKKALDLWKRYDISIYLRNNWSKLQKDLDGKIRISVGEGDNFYLNHAVHLLDNELAKLNANVEFEYYPGDHFTVFHKEYVQKGKKFLEQCYLRWLKEN